MKKKAESAVLASGGVDSSVLLAWAARRHSAVYPLFVESGYLWEKAEIYWLSKYLRALKNRKIKPLTRLRVPVGDLELPSWAKGEAPVPGRRSGDAAVYLPGRNLLLLSKAGVFCAQHKIPTLYLGILKGNPFPDSKPAFLKATQQAIGLALKRSVAVKAPFSTLNKKAVARWGHGLPLNFTFSCLSPRGLRPCGRCNKCAERDLVIEGGRTRPGL